MRGEPNITILAETFRLLGDPTRLKVMCACLEKPMPVAEIARSIDASPSLVSHHLRLLRAARLVRGERRNRQVFYGADDDHVRRMLTDMLAHADEVDVSGDDHGEAAPRI
ncbi:transcriptional regulator [Devosia pacifica]|uniref:Transcriptional regulator n=1 Tax=Devosia pacifica TaxID=1335967 RepID=A0A918S9W5_9HYPH|nr:metalloregulator ArsR/SmtB family transcription factor [Devosia pacifica]GHA32189.1 transcriptional regulator [Devosia pacifica]